MTDTLESGQDIEVFGRSGQRYSGKIYSDKNSSTSLSGIAVVCLTNSTLHDDIWYHHMNSVYSADAQQALEHFKMRDDIRQVILIPNNSVGNGQLNKVDDLTQNYLHG